MMRYLLLFFSTLFLLFTLPQPGRSVNSLAGTDLPRLTKSCQIKRNLKNACANNCQKHQAQQEQQSGSGLTADCTQQVFALAAALPAESLYLFSSAPATTPAAARKPLSPDLEIYPEPPRLS